MIVFDLIADRFELGTGIFSPQGLLVGLDQRLDDAVALGIDLDSARAFVAAHP